MTSLGIVMADNGHDVEYAFALTSADVNTIMESLRLYNPPDAVASGLKGRILAQLVEATASPALPLDAGT